MLPAGSTYALAAHPGFVRRADALFRASGCTLKLWGQDIQTRKVLRPKDGIHGMPGIHGIFRSCPSVKRELLTNANGRIVDFIVYPEVAMGRQYQSDFGYGSRIPEHRIDDDLATQAKQRWAILTQFPRASEEELRAASWSTNLQSTANSGDSKPHPLKRILHCAIEEGSRWPRRQSWYTCAKNIRSPVGAAIADVDPAAWEQAWKAYDENPLGGGFARHLQTEVVQKE